MKKIILTRKQQDAIKVYVDSSLEMHSSSVNLDEIVLDKVGFTFQLNGILRAGLSLSRDLDKFCDLLDGAFNSHISTEDMLVYRAFNYKEMLRYLHADNYVDFGYMSTSKTIDSTRKFIESPKIGYSPALLKIGIPAGSNILDLDNIDNFDNTTYEDEVLLKRRSMFNVTSCREVEANSVVKDFRLEIDDFDKIHVIEMLFMRYL